MHQRALSVRRGALLCATALAGAVVCVTLTLAPTPALAQACGGPCIWTGRIDNDWNTRANWNTNQVPATRDQVVLTNAGNAPSNQNDNNIGPSGLQSITLNPNAAGYTVNVTVAPQGFRLQPGGSFTDNNTLAPDTFGGTALGLNGSTIFTVVSGASLTFQNSITDGSATGSLIKAGAGTLTLSSANTYSGGTTVTGGLINFNSASNFGSGLITLNGGGLQWASGTSTDISSQLAPFGSNGATFDTNGNNVTLASALSGTGGLTKIGSGTMTLTGTDTYSGPTTVNAGTLTVNGSIANSTVTVNSGATLNGTGTVGGLTIASGATFAPGNSPGTMTVAGNLAFQSAAIYLVQITPSTASSTNVSGSATLAGTVQAAFASGSYATRTYTILSAAGGLGGTTFNALATSNLE
jgi:autotransporter-associated beta strand protein